MSFKSELSKASQQSQLVFQEISKTANSNLSKIIGTLDTSMLNQAWEGLGNYIQKQIRVGRAVQIPKFGLFTYSAPDFNMNGTTNPYERDQEDREPIFMISKDFAIGMNLIPSLFRNTGLRPIVLSSTAGRIQTQMINWSEVAQLAQMDNDSVRIAIQRIIRKLDEFCKKNQSTIVIEMPGVGQFIIKNNMAAICFNHYLSKEIKGLLKIPILERKDNASKKITKEKLSQFQKSMENLEHPGVQNQQNQLNKSDDKIEIENQAQDWLSQQLNIDINALMKSQTPSIGGASISSKKNAMSKDNQSESSSNLLFESVSQRGYTKLSADNQQQQQKQQNTNKMVYSLESLVIQKMKSYLRQRNLRTEDCFLQMLHIVHGINANKRSKLNLKQFQTALNKLEFQFFDYESEMLYKTLDKNNDKILDLLEFQECLIEEKSPDKQLQDVINKYNLSLDDFLKTLGIKMDDPPLIQEKLSKAFQKLPLFSKNDAQKIAKHIMSERITITLSQIMEYLQNHMWSALNGVKQEDGNIKLEENQDIFDTNWTIQKLRQMKIILDQHPNPKFLLQQFQSIDDKICGQINVNDFKHILLKNNNFFKFKIEDINRIARYLDRDKNENSVIDYYKFLERIDNSQNNYIQNNKQIDQLAEYLNQYLDKNKMNPEQFINFLIQDKQDRKVYNIDSLGHLKIYVFAKLCAKKVFTAENKQLILSQANFIDIDKDGYIDQYDLDTFLNRYHYIDRKQHNLNSFQNSSQNTTNNQFSDARQKSLHNQNQNMRTLGAQNVQQTELQHALFPDVQLDEKSLEIIFRQVKQALQANKLSLDDAYKMFDEDGDGFISFSELNQGLDKWLKLTQKAKEGLFSYLDVLKIGMFDYKRWINVMKRYVMDKSKVYIDNWDIQTQMINDLKKWYQENKLSPEQAFRIMDQDFDGFISKEDLSEFYIKQLKYNPEDANTQVLDRLFKLLDTFKRGYIQKSDISKVLLEDFNNNLQNSNLVSSRNTQISTPKTSSVRSNSKKLTSQNWFINACQQIAFALSKKFNSILESFESISHSQVKVGYKIFQDFMYKNRILEGFNVTEQLMQKLYAYIDPHKKGYITQKDWMIAFDSFVTAKEMPLIDIKSSLQYNFKSNEEAFKFFHKIEKTQQLENSQNDNLQRFVFNSSSDGNGITLNSNKNANSKKPRLTLILKAKKLNFYKFSRGIKSLFHHIYPDQQIEAIWKQGLEKLNRPINHNFTEEEISFEEFVNIFGVLRQNDLQNIEQNDNSSNNNNNNFSIKNHFLGREVSFMKNSNSLGRLSSISSKIKEAPNQYKGNFILHKFKELMIGSGKDVNEVFSKIDSQNNGIVSNLEFKNGIMSLNLGISQADLNLVLTVADMKGTGQINWKEFFKKLTLTESEQAIVKRSSQKIQKLKQNLYTYMISPKDAFREFDKKKQGSLNFSEFQEFINKLSTLSGEEVPPYSVLKDLFEFIDIKQDGQIDINEWLHTFIRVDFKKDLEIISPQQGGGSQTPQNFRYSEIKPMTAGNKKLRLKAMSVSNFNFINEKTQNWEKSKEYDDAVMMIGKNRHFLYEQLKKIAEQEQVMGRKSEKTEVNNLNYHKVKHVIDTLLKKHMIEVGEQNWKTLIGFAEKKGVIDLKFLFDVYKQRIEAIESHPLFNK